MHTPSYNLYIAHEDVHILSFQTLYIHAYESGLFAKTRSFKSTALRTGNNFMYRKISTAALTKDLLNISQRVVHEYTDTESRTWQHACVQKEQLPISVLP